MLMTKSNPLLKIINKSLINLPSPSNISFYWNFGSLLGLMMIIQISSGLILSFHYTPDASYAFSSLILASRNINYFWLIRFMHANGASLIFLLIYLHIARNVYISSYKNSNTWNSGLSMYIILMMIAFMGYVLPWGQMSYWGVTVITNLLTAIPLVGQKIVLWLWGDYSVSNVTLKRFYVLHFLLPFIMLLMIIMHLFFLHQTGSSNPLGLNSFNDMLIFHPFFIMKDILGVSLTMLIFLTIILTNPLMLIDPENFINANPMITPIHIQPEWYFLFAYAILRAIPSKLKGIMALLMSITILFLFPISKSKLPMKFHPIKKMIFWLFINTFILLTWLGTNPPSQPFLFLSSCFSFLYFLTIIILLSLPN